MGRIFMFTSLKGGVGKTTATSALGFALSFLAGRVLCVDLDFGVRGLDLALGAEDRCSTDVLEVLQEELDPAEEAVCLRENLYFLSAPALFNTREAGAVSPNMLSLFLSRCREEFDFTLLDLPAGGGELFLPLAKSGAITDTVVVSTTEEAALRAAEQTGYEVRGAGNSEVRLILNRVPVKKRDAKKSLLSMVQSAAIPVLGVVPEEPLVKETASEGIALTRLPSVAASRAYWNIACRICRTEVPLLAGVVSERRRKALCR